jgi:amino acid permease
MRLTSATVMIAETISLGILSLPSVLATVGLVPGFLLILGLGVIATYSGYVIGQFKERYPWVVIVTGCDHCTFANLAKQLGPQHG